MNPFQVYSSSRHVRYIFFIDGAMPYPDVVALIKRNLSIWGGRYNPIVPVTSGVIDPAYRALIQHYDPDIVFHSPSIDVDIIKKLQLFNPNKFEYLQTGRTEIDGINALCLLSSAIRHRRIIETRGLHKVESSLMDYFHLNFGIDRNSYVGDDQLMEGMEKIRVEPENFNQLHSLLLIKRPLVRSDLSGLDLHTPILRNFAEAPAEAIELVVAKETTSITDLLYFWNRKLYQCSRIFYITVEQIALLKTDKYFAYVLNDLAGGRLISIVSFSVPETEIQELLSTHIPHIPFDRLFTLKKINQFPFPIDDAQGAYPAQRGPSAVQTLGMHESLLLTQSHPHSPNPSGPQKWAVDIVVMELRSRSQVEVCFPFTTDTGYFIRGADSRVNRGRRLTYYADGRRSNFQALELRLPSFTELLRQLISAPVLDSTGVRTKYIDIGPHDPGNRLSAFIDLFKGNFELINEYFSDRFWIDLFDELCQSNKAAGDAISLRDLTLRCRKLMEQEGVVFGIWPATRQNEENLVLGLKEMLQELTALTVFIPGHTLKCTKCSTTAWYPLEQVTTRVRCSGCLADFKLPIDPAFTYRLNGLVQKNIFQSKTQRDGNLTIILTLTHLAKQAQGGFDFSPQLNLYTDPRNRTPGSDIDIVALQHSSFVIGEGKYDSSEFGANSQKSLLSLIDIAQAIRPDRVIISCTVDQHNRLQNAKNFLEARFFNVPYAPAVEVYQVSAPTYFNFKGASKYFYY